MKRKTKASPDPAVASAAAWGWHLTVVRLGELADDVRELAPEIGKFVETLQYVCATIAREASPSESCEELLDRLAKGFPRGKSRALHAATPLGKAKEYARQRFVEEGSKYTTRIAFAEAMLPEVERIVGKPVDAQKTIVDRWLKDL